MGPTGFFCLFSAAFLIACSDDKPEVDRCVRVREHLIDLRLAQATKIDRDAHRHALRAALGDDFVTTCHASLNASQQACVLKAANTQSASACGKETP
jgi:hypothetical protein